MQFEALENPHIAASGGAGISTARIIADKGVEVVLTGNCGPNAYQTLSAAGIQVITGVSGRIRDAVEAYETGKLQPSAQPSVDSHYGMGMGRGMCRGMGRGMWPGTMPQAASREQQIEMLKSQAQTMAQQLCDVQDPNANILLNLAVKRSRLTKLAYHRRLKQEGEGIEFIAGHTFGSTDYTIKILYK